MKKIGLIFSLILIPSIMFGVGRSPKITSPNEFNIPAYLSTSGHTSVVQWGCPVMEVISAKSQAEAMQILSEACMNEARKQVIKKPGVFDVINVSVIWPDVNVSSQQNGYLLRGTFFLETLVLKSMSGE